VSYTSRATLRVKLGEDVSIPVTDDGPAWELAVGSGAAVIAVTAWPPLPAVAAGVAAEAVVLAEGKRGGPAAVHADAASATVASVTADASTFVFPTVGRIPS
jgi:hypothetical protein